MVLRMNGAYQNKERITFFCVSLVTLIPIYPNGRLFGQRYPPPFLKHKMKNCKEED